MPNSTIRQSIQRQIDQAQKKIERLERQLEQYKPEPLLLEDVCWGSIRDVMCLNDSGDAVLIEETAVSCTDIPRIINWLQKIQEDLV